MAKDVNAEPPEETPEARAARAALVNAEDHLASAQVLEKAGRRGHGFAHLVLALEQLGRAIAFRRMAEPTPAGADVRVAQEVGGGLDLSRSHLAKSYEAMKGSAWPALVELGLAVVVAMVRQGALLRDPGSRPGAEAPIEGSSEEPALVDPLAPPSGWAHANPKDIERLGKKPENERALWRPLFYLEERKQRGLYVDLVDGDLRTPKEVRPEEYRAMLHLVRLLLRWGAIDIKKVTGLDILRALDPALREAFFEELLRAFGATPP